MSTVVQNVNLYLPEFRRKKHWLDAEKFVLVAGAALLLLLVASGVEYWQLAQLRSELAQKELERQQAVAATAALEAQYGTQTEDPALLADIRELEENLQSKQALLEFLEGRELGNAGGFSEHLAELSRHHVEGLSLNRISLSDGGRVVELGGQVIKADLVPVFVQQLGRGRTYSGMQFEKLDIADEPVAGGSGDESGAARLEVWNFEVGSMKR